MIVISQFQSVLSGCDSCAARLRESSCDWTTDISEFSTAASEINSLSATDVDKLAESTANSDREMLVE